jgi:hypothetical protein
LRLPDVEIADREETHVGRIIALIGADVPP